jgi:hypothetical protein
MGRALLESLFSHEIINKCVALTSREGPGGAGHLRCDSISFVVADMAAAKSTQLDSTVTVKAMLLGGFSFQMLLQYHFVLHRWSSNNARI